jgi:hypothetical protein
MCNWTYAMLAVGNTQSLPINDPEFLADIERSQPVALGTACSIVQAECGYPVAALRFSKDSIAELD